MRLLIATRRSPLALWQANHVRELLEQHGHSVRLHEVTTTGDLVHDRPLNKIGGKGLFLKEIQQALARGEADLAVHSMKDVPVEMPPGHVLGATLVRDDARDCLVSRSGLRLQELPVAARVGTSSLRRAMMCRQVRPDLQIEFVRGNVEGRIAKLDRGDFDAILLATAGLRRLGLEHRASQVLEPDLMLPAMGQGAIGVELMAGHPELAAALVPLRHEPTEFCVSAEREVGRLVGASCAEPFAAHAVLEDGWMVLSAKWGSALVGAPLVCASARAAVSRREHALELGRTVGQMLHGTFPPAHQVAT